MATNGNQNDVVLLEGDDNNDELNGPPSPKRPSRDCVLTPPPPTMASCSTDIGRDKYWPFTDKHKLFRRDPSKYHLIIAVTGSVASIKLPEVIKELRQICGDRISIRVVVTNNAKHFIEIDQPLQEDIVVYEDSHEWTAWSGRGDPVLHIELRRWADALLIAPLDANTMAKLANGLCDNLITCLARAWDPQKSVFFAPAMNSYMWQHPHTFKQMQVLKGLLQYKEIPAIEKQLVCGDTGPGAMAEPKMIASIVNADVKAKFTMVSYH